MQLIALQVQAEATARSMADINTRQVEQGNAIGNQAARMTVVEGEVRTLYSSLAQQLENQNRLVQESTQERRQFMRMMKNMSVQSKDAGGDDNDEESDESEEEENEVFIKSPSKRARIPPPAGPADNPR